MHEEILHKTKEKVISGKLIITLQQQGNYIIPHNSWISISRNQSTRLNLEMQENKDSIIPWGVKLLWLQSVRQTPFSPSLLYLPSKHLNVWCVVYFTNRAKKYIYIYIHTYPWYGMVNVDRCDLSLKTFNSLPGTYLWHAYTSRRSV